MRSASARRPSHSIRSSNFFLVSRGVCFHSAYSAPISSYRAMASISHPARSTRAQNSAALSFFLLLGGSLASRSSIQPRMLATSQYACLATARYLQQTSHGLSLILPWLHLTRVHEEPKMRPRRPSSHMAEGLFSVE